MLVLTRKAQEQIQIGSEITISILKVKGNSVRVGIQAPRDVRIVRGELPVFTCEVELSEGDVDSSPQCSDEVPAAKSATMRDFIAARRVVAEPLSV